MPGNPNPIHTRAEAGLVAAKQPIRAATSATVPIERRRNCEEVLIMGRSMPAELYPDCVGA